MRLAFSPADVALAAYPAGLPLAVNPVQTACGHPKLARLLGLTRALDEVDMTLMPGGNISDRANTRSPKIFNAVSAGGFDWPVVLCGRLVWASLLLYAAITPKESTCKFTKATRFWTNCSWKTAPTWT